MLALCTPVAASRSSGPSQWRWASMRSGVDSGSIAATSYEERSSSTTLVTVTSPILISLVISLIGASPGGSFWLRRGVGARHRLGPDDAVEVLRLDVAQGQRGLAKRHSLVIGVLGDLGGLVVADVGRQRRDQHESFL